MIAVGISWRERISLRISWLGYAILRSSGSGTFLTFLLWLVFCLLAKVKQKTRESGQKRQQLSAGDDLHHYHTRH